MMSTLLGLHSDSGQGGRSVRTSRSRTPSPMRQVSMAALHAFCIVLSQYFAVQYNAHFFELCAPRKRPHASPIFMFPWATVMLNALAVAPGGRSLSVLGDRATLAPLLHLASALALFLSFLSAECGTLQSSWLGGQGQGGDCSRQ